MTQQAVVELTPAQPELTGDGAVDCPSDQAGEEALVAEELLVEDVSIDGMCGVY